MNTKIPSVFIGVVFLSAGCVAPREAWRCGEKPLVISHRGSRGEFDDNAKGGFAWCLTRGIRGYETDVRLTADDGIAIMHDKDVSRTTTSTGDVHAVTLAQFRSFKLKRSGEFAPGLDDLVPVFAGRKNIRVEFEMKEDVAFLGPERGETYCRKVHDAVVRGMEPGTYVFTSFNTNTLACVKRLYPDAPLAFISMRPCEREVVDTAVALGCRAVAPVFWGTTREQVDYAHGRGLDVSLWMVNDWPTYEIAAALGADTVTTDIPATILKAAR